MSMKYSDTWPERWSGREGVVRQSGLQLETGQKTPVCRFPSVTNTRVGANCTTALKKRKKELEVAA